MPKHITLTRIQASPAYIYLPRQNLTLTLRVTRFTHIAEPTMNDPSVWLYVTDIFYFELIIDFIIVLLSANVIVFFLF